MSSELLTNYPNIGKYQDFFNSSATLFDSIRGMKTKSLKLTKEVLKDREQIEATIEGLSLKVKEQLAIKVKIDCEKRILEQHAADANANKDTEYEYDEPRMVKISLEARTYVTNCLKCNTTCHFPCFIPKDEDKSGCAAMRGGECTVCEGRCGCEAAAVA